MFTKNEMSRLYDNKLQQNIVAFDKDIKKEKFNSNNVWKFKAECDGYEEEIFSLLIDWYQDTVYCNFNLQKKYDTKLKK